jgi:hypothetical protein
MTNAGWHPDPLERHQLRYFDGERWTPHVVDGSDLSLDPLAPAPTETEQDEPASDAPDGSRARRRRVQWLVLVGILVLIAAATAGAVAFASSSSTKTVKVQGSFVIRNAADGPPYVSDGRGGCKGDSRLRDVNARTPVVIQGDHGNALTRTALGPGHVAGDGCVFRFTFTVEKGAAYYVVSVGARSSGEYTFAQLQQPDAVALVLAAQ